MIEESEFAKVASNRNKKILVLGGYGNFGRLICEHLANRQDIELIIGGRNEAKANQFIASLKKRRAKCECTAFILDIFSERFAQALSVLKPFIVIHTSGPFQGQDYYVPKACVEAGSHYIDLADDRRFVYDFATLNALAEKTGTIAVSGASSVPGLSSVVVDHYANAFAQLDAIDLAIVPGSNVELGEATLRGILSYTGHAFKGWDCGHAVDRYGWMDVRRKDFGNVLGKRWLANVDVPDLELFPTRYPGVKTVRFQAGHELTIVHLGMAVMGALAKCHVVKRWDKYTAPMYGLGQKLKRLGSGTGGMCIELTGTDKNGARQTLTWRLIAPNGVGPRIPTFPALILTEKILDNTLTTPMATPCLGMFELEAFNEMAKRFGIYQEVERTNG